MVLQATTLAAFNRLVNDPQAVSDVLDQIDDSDTEIDTDARPKKCLPRKKNLGGRALPPAFPWSVPPHRQMVPAPTHISIAEPAKF